MPKPRLSDSLEVPQSINGWHYDSEDTSNGHVWRSSEHDCSVGVFDPLTAVCVRVRDDRVRGFGGQVDLERLAYDDEHDRVDALESGFDRAREWMADTPPEAWTHPEVCEAVFDSPQGYELEAYYLGDRESEVYYRRQDFGEEVPRRVKLEGPECLTVENAPYLYLHTWNGSGNATVALAPWTNAHGPKCKHPEVREIVETPDECGLEVAVTIARQWARENGSGTGEGVGQRDLTQYTPRAATDGGDTV
ncbi:hypothetical protein [Natronosalvus amylolyticus]|uniref:hypothetical protein n=1 Tax=Natronosalvus amylolyticus TaxID=2961994 RepID=UPI0020C97C5B|nr:hypothetical protein [Natronosalvus amylolyticus]